LAGGLTEVESEVAKKKRQRGLNDGGAIDQRPSGRWRLRVSLDGRQVIYGTYETEDEAATAQARWRLTHLLPADDPQLAVEKPASVAAGGVRCDEWFERWQAAKEARQSRVRVGRQRGGAASTAARDRAQWKTWWSPALGGRLPHTLVEADVTEVLQRMETAGRAPKTVLTHWIMIKAFLNWLVASKVISASPVGQVVIDVDPVEDRVREIVVPDFRFLDLLSQLLGTGRSWRSRDAWCATRARRVVGPVLWLSARSWRCCYGSTC
jgi:hypothetical protein